MARTLIEGTTGDDVKMLQAVLNYHRVAPTDEILTVDGIFGPKTKTRVKSFQSQNLLAADGIVGPITAGKLMTICQFSAEYVAIRDEDEVVTGDEFGNGPAVTTHYELKDGLKLTLNPWKKPPAKAQYVLEFEAAWVVKNPNNSTSSALIIGAEIGRTLTTLSPDAPYRYSGAGQVKGKVEKDFTLGPIKLDTSIQGGFEAEHEVNSTHVQISSQLSLVSGISFTIVHDRFYLFTQGELGVVVKWFPGTVQPSAQWEGTGGFKLTF
jgi:peptidoglycan hydrolase-like protein with peptidoglycan-binding domain